MITEGDNKGDESAASQVVIECVEFSIYVCVCVSCLSLHVAVPAQYSSKHHTPAARATTANAFFEYLRLYYPWHWRSPGTPWSIIIKLSCMCLCVALIFFASLIERVHCPSRCQDGLHEWFYGLRRYNPRLLLLFMTQPPTAECCGHTAPLLSSHTLASSTFICFLSFHSVHRCVFSSL